MITQTDPMPYGPGSVYESPYAYALNNPLTYTDPNGERGQLAGCGSKNNNPIGSWFTRRRLGEDSVTSPLVQPALSPFSVSSGRRIPSAYAGTRRANGINAGESKCQHCYDDFNRKGDMLGAAVQLSIETGRKDCWQTYHHAYKIAEEVRDKCVADCEAEPEPEPEPDARRRRKVVTAPRPPVTRPPVVFPRPVPGPVVSPRPVPGPVVVLYA